MKYVMFLLLVIPLTAGVITKTFEFSRNDLVFTDYGRYTLVELKGSDQIAKLGEPILPAPILHFVIPPDAEVASVELIEEEVEDLPGFYILYPGQRPRPLTQHFYDKSAGQVPRTKFQEPKENIYNSEEFYPEKVLEYTKSGSKGGFRILSITLYPLRYLPKDGRLRLSKKLTVKINYQEGSHLVKTITERQFQVQKKAVQALVSNSEDVDQFRPNLRPNSINDVNYAIVTGQEFVDDFKPLVDWKTKKGWMARIFSVEWIYGNYPGYDNQEKIRNFFKDYYKNKGLIWAILGGDIQMVPDRDAYSTFYSPYYIATDWYYCDLDSNWNRDGDNRYGEIGDVIPSEAYFDIYAGRPPIDSSADVANFINKLFIFEKNPPDSGITTILLVSAGSLGVNCNNLIGDMFPPWWTIIKTESLLAPGTRDTINTYKPQFCHLATHGDRNGCYTSYGQPIFTEADIPYLINDLPFIVNSIASYVGQFDFSSDDCFAEELLNKTYPGGAIGAIMNSRYGFGQPPQLGPNEQMDTLFYHMVCYTDTLWLGVAFATSKEHFINSIWSQGIWHYCGTELNLFGGPEMGMYLKKPIPLYAAYPETIEAKPQSFLVTVTDSGGPVTNALVCCYKEGELHETGWTDASGLVSINISPQTPGVMYVTASCFNHLPYEDSCTVIEPGVAEGTSKPPERWIIPSVIKDQVLIKYSLPAEIDIEVSLVDAAGRKIKDLYKGNLSGNGKLIKSVKRLPAGIYYLIIKGDKKTNIKRMVILK